METPLYAGGAPLDPNFEPESNWQMDEYIPTAIAGTIAPANDVLRLDIPPALPFRKVYFYIEACLSVASADYFVTGRLSFYKNGTRIQDVHASLGQDINGTLLTSKSIIGIVNPSSAFGDDSKRLTTGSKFTSGADSVVVVPQRFLTYANLLTYSITGAKAQTGNVTCVRAFLGVYSSNHPY